MKMFESVPDLGNVKKQIIEWINLPNKNNALLFIGNPATGKSLMGKAMGEVCKDANLVSKGHVIETCYHMLVDNANKDVFNSSHKVFENAVGGVLFIAEALKTLRSIIYRKTTNNSIDYGTQIVDSLVDVMNNNKDLVVILEGEEKDIEDFFLHFPSLKSIFDYTIKFEDYSINELLEIFKFYCNKSKHIVSSDVEVKLLELFQKSIDNNKWYSNGMLAKVLYEKIVEDKIIKAYNSNLKEYINNITLDDLPEEIY